ncbi:MAG: TIGR01459 family HAD-type hydrolase [Alphaproteobacteria bacterium]|nr:TIGR01459 family HAD-type hydrolase [Alphaproteobacteria bacterium]
MSKFSEPIFANGLEKIASSFDAFIIDQWGVIHDGKHVFPGVVDALEHITALGKPAIIVTNSAKRNAYNMRRLASLGIPREIYTDLVSSAEVMRGLLVERQCAPWDSLGEKAFLVANEEDRGFLQGTEYQAVRDVGQADFVLLLSTKKETPLSAHESWINIAVERKLPVFSASADPLTFGPEGIFSGSAGIIKIIEEKGHTVINTGKPSELVYKRCSQLIPGIKPEKVLAIGDQIATDIIGAKRFGFSAALIMSGASERIFENAGSPEDAIRIAKSLASPELLPDIILLGLRWDGNETSAPFRRTASLHHGQANNEKLEQ